MTIQAPDTQQLQDSFTVLDTSLSFQTPDCKQWWDSVCPAISRHLKHTGYPSCIAGDTAPLDISVNYQSSKCTFRITMEPIGPYAGTNADPMNELAARQLLHRLGHIQPGIDLAWYDCLDDAMLIKNNLAREHGDALAQFHSKTQTLIGLDLHKAGSFTVEAYFFPHLRAAATGEGWADVMFSAIRKLDDTAGFSRTVDRIEAYVRSIRPRLVPEKPNVAIDCKSPATSRVKVYAAMETSSLQEVYDFWTLGGSLQGKHIEQGLEIVKSMWTMLYDELLPGNIPREAMTVHCNWEFSPSNPTPVPKAYFLLADDHDQHVVQAVTTLFQDLGWEHHVRTHEALARESEISEASTQVYTWLSFAYSKTSGPYITVYAKPFCW
ncbi:tryptophan dimethylallyltransferase-domain-containing protein [Aspergillus aurantiobrunneus]